MDKQQVFIATIGDGLMRAEQQSDGAWRVEARLSGVQINCLAADPHVPGMVYAGTQGSGLLRSEDRGRSRHPAGMDGQVVKAIAVSQSEVGVLYAGTKPPALFVSHNGAKSWAELPALRHMRRRHWFTPAEPGDPYVLGLGVSPTDPNRIVAGIEYGATLCSTDGGHSWQGHLKHTSRDCHALKFHDSDGNWVYQAGGGWPAAVSRDGGLNWRQPRRGMGWSLYAMACAADPARPEIWYVSAAPLLTFPHLHMMPRAHWDGHAGASIFRSEENSRWTRLGGGLPQPLDYMAYALLTDRQAPGHLYAGLSNGDVWHTVDYGAHWNRLPFNLMAINRALVML